MLLPCLQHGANDLTEACKQCAHKQQRHDAPNVSTWSHGIPALSADASAREESRMSDADGGEHLRESLLAQTLLDPPEKDSTKDCVDGCKDGQSVEDGTGVAVATHDALAPFVNHEHNNTSQEAIDAEDHNAAASATAAEETPARQVCASTPWPPNQPAAAATLSSGYHDQTPYGLQGYHNGHPNQPHSIYQQYSPQYPIQPAASIPSYASSPQIFDQAYPQPTSFGLFHGQNQPPQTPFQSGSFNPVAPAFAPRPHALSVSDGSSTDGGVPNDARYSFDEQPTHDMTKQDIGAASQPAQTPRSTKTSTSQALQFVPRSVSKRFGLDKKNRAKQRVDAAPEPARAYHHRALLKLVPRVLLMKRLDKKNRAKQGVDAAPQPAQTSHSTKTSARQASQFVPSSVHMRSGIDKKYRAQHSSIFAKTSRAQSRREVEFPQTPRDSSSHVDKPTSGVGRLSNRSAALHKKQTRGATSSIPIVKLSDESLRQQPTRWRPTERVETTGVLAKPQPMLEYLNAAAQDPQLDTHPNHLLVVIDLNGTLIHRKSGQNFTPRPHLDAFISYLIEHHTVLVWSSAQPVNVQGICCQIFSLDQMKKLAGIWARDTLRLTKKQYDRGGQVHKQLRWVWDHAGVQAEHPRAKEGQQWGQHNTVLIDDSALKAASEPHNNLLIEEFEAKPMQMKEDAFMQVVGYLELARQYKDVSAFMRETPFSPVKDYGWEWEVLQDEEEDAKVKKETQIPQLDGASDDAEVDVSGLGMLKI
ncbi:hypothetical protein LTR50_004343 [Elasticomyces elasticus]|nr:hypothetical protein LTR50_004343 [Elasticomyces elasticus]